MSPGLAGKAFDLEHVVRLDAVLLAAGLDDCVHGFGPSVFNRAHRRRRGRPSADFVILRMA
jgi:hypothetical protein